MLDQLILRYRFNCSDELRINLISKLESIGANCPEHAYPYMDEYWYAEGGQVHRTRMKINYDEPRTYAED